jgi:hypothetical protein
VTPARKAVRHFTGRANVLPVAVMTAIVSVLPACSSSGGTPTDVPSSTSVRGDVANRQISGRYCSRSSQNLCVEFGPPPPWVPPTSTACPWTNCAGYDTPPAVSIQWLLDGKPKGARGTMAGSPTVRLYAPGADDAGESFKPVTPTTIAYEHGAPPKTELFDRAP